MVEAGATTLPRIDGEHRMPVGQRKDWGGRLGVQLCAALRETNPEWAQLEDLDSVVVGGGLADDVVSAMADVVLSSIGIAASLGVLQSLDGSSRQLVKSGLAAMTQMIEGVTLHVEAADSWVSELRRLTRLLEVGTGRLESRFRANVYVSREGRPATPVHADPGLAVVVQLAGSKVWQWQTASKPELWQRRLSDASESVLTRDGSHQVRLDAGDWMLVGPRILHRPFAVGPDTSVHVTLRHFVAGVLAGSTAPSEPNYPPRLSRQLRPPAGPVLLRAGPAHSFLGPDWVSARGALVRLDMGLRSALLRLLREGDRTVEFESLSEADALATLLGLGIVEWEEDQ